MKKALVIGIPALILAGLALWFFGRPVYHQHKEQRFLQQARQFLAKGDFRNASLSARQTLQVDPQNLEASRIMAELAERLQSPSALDWRQRIAGLAPTFENKLLMANTALRAQGAPYSLTSQTLDELRDAGKSNAAYHVLCAELALKLKRPAEAAAHFEKAGKIEPGNDLHQLDLAVLRLASTNAVAAAEARATLERLSGSPTLGAVALRWLAAESLRQKQLPEAQRFSERLIARGQPTIEDSLQHLTILQQAGRPQFKSFLGAVQEKAATNALEIYAVCGWMISHDLLDDALSWVTNCPVQVQAEYPGPLALVDCYIAKKDWVTLENFLQKPKWGDLDFLRLAFLSRAAAEQKQALASESRWRMAVREAGDRLGPLMALLNMASTWGFDKGREDLLWIIGQRFPRERWAFEELNRMYDATGNTHGLYRLYSVTATESSTNIGAKNNLAAISMLLRLNLPTAHELARQIYKQQPQEPIVVSTYAYSLHLQGRTREGLSALEKLPPEALEQPSVALYYGLLLTAAGQTNEAGKYLLLAQHATLLPEEKTLLAQAAKKE